MKNILLLVCAFIFLGCISDDSRPIIGQISILGKWKLIEQLADPGDGSGTFQPASSNRILEFFSDETVTIDGSFCSTNGQTIESSGGTYQITSSPKMDVQFEGTIVPDNCNSQFTLGFNITVDNQLILWYPCIEPCAEKYIKVN